MNGQMQIFLNSVFFVLGFSLLFSSIGVLLETVLLNTGDSVQRWLGYVGGSIIIVFGIYLLGLINIPFLAKEHKINVGKLRGSYVTSFVFGAAFAVGWTPCVTAGLGAILGLAASNPSSAFILLMSYTLGLGLPFLLVGAFTSKARGLIDKTGPALKYVHYVFGALLILIGILVFTNELAKLANFAFATNILQAINPGTSVGESIASLTILTVLVAFMAGLASFLSPCILPIIPGFLTYLGSTVSKKNEQKKP